MCISSPPSYSPNIRLLALIFSLSSPPQPFTRTHHEPISDNLPKFLSRLPIEDNERSINSSCTSPLNQKYYDALCALNEEDKDSKCHDFGSTAILDIKDESAENTSASPPSLALQPTSSMASISSQIELRLVAAPDLRHASLLGSMFARIRLTPVQCAIIEYLGLRSGPQPAAAVVSAMGLSLHAVMCHYEALARAGVVLLVPDGAPSKRTVAKLTAAVLVTGASRDGGGRLAPVTRGAFCALLAGCTERTAVLGDLRSTLTASEKALQWSPVHLSLISEEFLEDFYTEVDGHIQHCVHLLEPYREWPVSHFHVSTTHTIAALLEAAGPAGASLREIIARTGLPRGVAEALMQAACGQRLCVAREGQPWGPRSVFLVPAFAPADCAVEVIPAAADHGILGQSGRVRSLQDQAKRRDRILMEMLEKDRVGEVLLVSGCFG